MAVSPALERHVGTILVAVVVGLLTWVGLTVTSNGQAIVRLDTKLTLALAATEKKADDHEQRLRRLEQRHPSSVRESRGSFGYNPDGDRVSVEDAN